MRALTAILFVFPMLGVSIAPALAADPPPSGVGGGFNPDALAGSQFVALIICFVAIFFLHRMVNHFITRTETVSDAQWRIVEKMADAQRESNALVRETLSLYGKRA